MARIDYVELPSATAHELTRAFYAKAFGWDFTDYGPTYSATDQRHDRRRPSGRSVRRALGAAAGGPGRRSRSRVRCGDQGRRDDRQADLLISGRPPVSFHRPGRERARGVERGLTRLRLRPRVRADPIGDRVDARLGIEIDRQPAGAPKAAASSLSQRGAQPRGSRRSDTTISASAQARVSSSPFDARRRAHREQPPFLVRPS